jgi:hypothetical protein
VPCQGRRIVVKPIAGLARGGTSPARRFLLVALDAADPAGDGYSAATKTACRERREPTGPATRPKSGVTGSPSPAHLGRMTAWYPTLPAASEHSLA